VIARKWLWEAGLDYKHGTGHGVGYYLNVHEGPHSISLKGSEPIVPGVVISNGIYLFIYL
jgi:Xaa-Pro aminopeptidase